SFLSLIILYSAVLSGTSSSRDGFFDMLVIDTYAFIFKAIFLVGAGVAVALSIPPADEESSGAHHPLMLFAATGMMFMASSVDLLTMFVSLELMAGALYVLVGYLRRAEDSHRAAVKYFLFGAFSSAILLYGISLIYGLTGSTNLANVTA